MKLVWTWPARDDRKAIRDYIAVDNQNAALDLDDLLSKEASRLVGLPGLGRPGRVPGTRELVAHSHYILVYDVVGDAVRVLHSARMWPPK